MGKSWKTPADEPEEKDLPELVGHLTGTTNTVVWGCPIHGAALKQCCEWGQVRAPRSCGEHGICGCGKSQPCSVEEFLLGYRHWNKDLCLGRIIDLLMQMLGDDNCRIPNRIHNLAKDFSKSRRYKGEGVDDIHARSTHLDGALMCYLDETKGRLIRYSGDPRVDEINQIFSHMQVCEKADRADRYDPYGVDDPEEALKRTWRDTFKE